MSGVAGDDGEEEQEAKEDGEDNDEDQEDQDEDIVCVPCENAPVVIAKNPYNPTHEEKEAHNATHLPYRSWCPVCVQARGREDDHKRDKEKAKDGKVTINIDYKSFGQDIDDDKLTSIIMRDSRTGCTASHICESKGISDSWVVQKLVDDIDAWGYTDIIMKSDGEPALVKVVEEVKRRRKHSTIPQNPPAYDPQANGTAEHAVQDVMAQMRAIKLGLEQRTKMKVETNWRILEWMIEHASSLINMCLVGHDGKTPRSRLLGKDSAKAILEFGEQVLAKPMRAQQKEKVVIQVKMGVWHVAGDGNQVQ